MHMWEEPLTYKELAAVISITVTVVILLLVLFWRM